MGSAERKELKCVKEQVLAVQRMQDYIEKNRTEDITLSELAGASLFSPWYSYRLFREYIGLTPTEYIRKYRLTQAARLLRAGDVKVIDAAFAVGFSNADTFTRAFYREFGLNPGDYMKHPVPVTFFIPYGAKYRELRKENIDVSNIQTVFVQIVRKPERLCIIRRGRKAEDYFPYCEEVSCDVWGILTSMRSLCGEPVSMWLPQAVSTMREYKILKRLRVTPVGPVFILGVELTMYIVYCAVSLAVLAVPAALFWHVRLRGSLLRFIGSWALTMLSTLSVGMLVGGVARDTKQAGVIASVLYFPMLVFSGTTLPLEVMPRAMQKIVSLFPLTQGITMMKNAFIGADTGSMLLPVCAMLGLTALCTALSIRFFRWE